MPSPHGQDPGSRLRWHQLDRRQVQQHVLFVLIVVLLALRHLAIFYSEAEFPHFPQLVDAFKQLDGQQLWVKGTAVWETRLQLGGPLFYWLNLPVQAFDNPVVGVHVYYFLLELVVICLWLLCGPRTQLTCELSWAAGFFMALYFNSKSIVCENMTMAVYLSALLFLALVWAMGKRSSKPMLLVGLLLGAAVQVHVTTLALAPPVLAVILLDRPDLRVRRLALLGGAWLAVLLLSLPGISAPDQQHTSYALGQLATRFSWGNLASRLLLSGLWPLALLGLGLGIYTWRKDGVRTAGLRLTMLWMVIPFVLLSVALAYMGPHVPNESRYAMLNPARALLAGMGLTWLLARINPWLQRRLRREVDVLDVLIGAGLILVLITSLDARRHWEAFEQRQTARRGQPCNCDYWQYRDLSRHFYTFYEAVQRRGLPPQIAGSVVQANAPNREDTEALIYWMQSRRGARKPKRGVHKGAKPQGQTNHLVVTPRLAGFDLSRLRGAISYGSFLMIPGCLPGKLKQLSAGRYAVTPHPDAGPAQMLLVTIMGRDKFQVPASVGVRAGGRTRAPRSGCHCYDPTDFYSYGGWMLFDAATQTAAAPQLLFDVKAGEVDTVQVYSLPPLALPR